MKQKSAIIHLFYFNTVIVATLTQYFLKARGYFIVMVYDFESPNVRYEDGV